MDTKHFYKDTHFYAYFRAYVKIIHWLFYKEIVSEGLENIPEHEPTIFATNHQNALMDAQAVIMTVKQQPAFLTRADVFKNKKIASFLYQLKMLPIYRIRDGAETLKYNDDIFELCIKILEAKQTLGLFPEAQHNNKRALLQLKKAVPRIAFLTEQKNDWKLGLKVVPVGIYYDDYANWNSVLHVKYGEPILVSDFKDIYLKNESRAMLALRDEMAKRISPLTVDIQNVDNYDAFETAREIFEEKVLKENNLGKNQKNKMLADKITIDKLNNYSKNNYDNFVELCAKLTDYKTFTANINLSDKIIKRKSSNLFTIISQFILLTICFPIYLYGFINNFFITHLPEILVKKLKDRQFHSSVRFGLSIITFPIFYIIQSIILSLFTEGSIFIISYIILNLITFNFQFIYQNWFRDFKELIRYRTLKINKNLDLLNAEKLRAEILLLNF